jgi:hypothetical protein
LIPIEIFTSNTQHHQTSSSISSLVLESQIAKMQFTTLAVGLLASLSSVTAVALEKRVDHYGIATVNPNPSNGLGSCGNPFRDSQYKVRSFPKTKRRDTLTDGGFKVALSNYWMKNQSPSSYCGRKIVLTNTGPSGDNSVGGKGNSVVVT